MATSRPTRASKPSRPTGAPIACVLFEIDLVSALGYAGIPCAVAAAPGDPANYSRHTKERLAWFDPRDETDKMLASLIGWAKNRAYKPVLFFSADHDLLMVSRNRAELADWFEFVVADEALVEDLVDKDRFTRLARDLDLPVPPTTSFDPAATEPGDLEIAFPLVVKPARRRDETWLPVSAGGKAVHVEDRETLARLWPSLHGQGRMLAQTLIPGSEALVESYHVYVDGSGERVCEFTGRKIRTLPSHFGDTAALEITARRDVMEVGRALVAKMRLTGVAKFDFKRDADGRLWLLEVNPRFNLWHHAGAVAGANIPALVYARLTGHASPTSCTPRAGTTWCHPTRDARAARHARVPLMRWLPWALRADAKWALSLRDPMPFVRGVLVRRFAAKLRRRS